jgi:plasmid stability protein
MPSIVLPNVPESLFASLRDRASRHGTSIEEETIHCLEKALGAAGLSQKQAEHVLAEVDQLRASLGDLYLTEAELQQAKREGRP